MLWEFSEEHPPIISNFGMGSILVNYYRKKNEKDDHIPKVRGSKRLITPTTWLMLYSMTLENPLLSSLKMNHHS